jgi:dUTP pyrophosphatase
MPVRAHPTDAGADLFSMENLDIYPGETKMIDTGVCIKIPAGYVGLVYNRSSQGKIHVVIPHSVGVIDSDYRGVIKIILMNQGEDPYKITRFDTRIAQLVIAPILLPVFKGWADNGKWEDTERGANGFGSTNNKGNK